MENSSETIRLLGRCEEGDDASLGKLLVRHEDRLRRLVVFRLDRRLRSRIDPSDVIQEAHLAASKSLGGYLKQPSAPFLPWLRGVVFHKLIELHRFHLGTPSRDPRREAPGLIDANNREEAGLATPSEAAMEAEFKSGLQGAIDRLDLNDREILALRHFQYLTNAQAAAVLSISEAAAGKRYLRALEHLRGVLESSP